MSGYGEQRITCQLGRPLAETDDEQVVDQAEILGDVLVSVTG